MDRQIVYAGAIPLDTDQLLQNRSVMTALGFVLQAMLGTGPNIDGLACTPTSPATMQVQIGTGAIYSLQNLDGNAYGSLPADTSSNHQIVKQGLLTAPILLSCPAPAGVGQSINYLIEAAYQDADTGATVLPYFNSANPAQPFSGPNNTGLSQSTVRQGQCVVQVKAGVAATTGTQTTPAADTGFIGLYVVTVAQSTTSITSANISVIPAAPFIQFKLPNLTPGFSNIQVFTTSGTFTVPPGITKLWVEGWGGGGGGSGNPANTAGSGGSGASYGARLIMVAPGQIIAVIVGAAGNGGAAGANNGQTGGTSSFGSLLSISGGQGGVTTSGSGTPTGVVPTADIAIAGGGAPGTVAPNSGSGAGAFGAGGSAPRGGAGGNLSSFGGIAGNAPGGGGGPGFGSTPTGGGAGARGQINVFF
ncbi:MAG TPA: hypothetical protein VM689_20560 [Aliidongia sp.]|nr:hypothetical protein [Aliidongia sp.]